MKLIHVKDNSLLNPSFTKRQEKRHERWVQKYGAIATKILATIQPYDESQKLEIKKSIACEKKRELTERLGKPAFERLFTHFQQKSAHKDFLWISQEMEASLGTFLQSKQQAEQNRRVLEGMRDQIVEYIEFDRVVAAYFSSYLSGATPVNVDLLSKVFQRVKEGGRVNRFISREVIHLFDSQEPLPQIALYALEDQMALDRYLQKLQKLDLYRKLELEALSSLDSLQEKMEFLAELKKRQEALEKEVETLPTLREVLIDSLKLSLRDIGEFRKTMDAKPVLDRILEIDKILYQEKEIAGQQREELQAEKEICMLKMKEALQLVDLEAFQIQVRERIQSLRLDNNSEDAIQKYSTAMEKSFQMARRGILGSLLAKLEVIAKDSSELGQIWDQTLRSLLLEEPSHSQVQKIDVVPLGFEEGDILAPANGKWTVIDATRCPSPEAKKLFTPEMLAEFLKGKKPGEVVSFDVKKGQLVPHKRGSIRIFYESAASVLQRKSFGLEKKKSWLSCLFSQKDVSRTAAVDRLQTVRMMRVLATAILSERPVNLHTFQRASEFFAMTEPSDPLVQEALRYWEALKEPLSQQIKERAERSFLAQNVSVRKLDVASSAKVLLESFESLKRWHKNMSQLIDLYDDIPMIMTPFSRHIKELKEKSPQIHALVVKSQTIVERLKGNHSTAVLQEALSQLTQTIQALTPIVSSLAAPEASHSLRAHRTALLQKLKKKHPQATVREFHRLSELVFPHFPQILPQQKLILQSLASYSSELGPLWWQIFSTYSTAVEEVQKSEEHRMNTIRGLRTKAIDHYYPSSPETIV